MSSKTIRAFLGFLGLICLVGFLGKIFSGSYVLPQTFSLGSVVFHYYGLTMAAAVGVGWWLALRRAPRYGFTTSQADSFFQWLVAGGFVGARLYHVASSWQYYWQYPLDIVKVWHGGLSIFGALIGGFVVLCFYRRMTRSGSSPLEERWGEVMESSDNARAPLPPPLTLPHAGKDKTKRLLSLLDWLAPSVLLGQIIGRFGNFFNYEAFGYPATVPWKMFVPIQFRPVEFQQSQFFHPLFLYEAVGNAVILFVLLRLSNRSGRAAGRLFFLYLFLYNTLRFVIEFWRIDSTFLWGFIRLNTLTSSLLCLIGIAGLVFQFLYARESSSKME